MDRHLYLHDHVHVRALHGRGYAHARVHAHASRACDYSHVHVHAYANLISSAYSYALEISLVIPQVLYVEIRAEILYNSD